MDKPITQFTTNGFADNPTQSIAIATVSGMGLMFLGISVNAPILISMILLFGGILGVYGYRVGQVEYRWFKWGFEQKIRRYLPYKLSKKESTRRFLWNDIRSFRHDTDKNRNMEEYEFIKLYLTKAPRQIWITNQKNASGFNAFRDAFLSLVVSPSKKQALKSKSTPNVSASSSLVRQRKSFYKTTSGKVLTILLVLLVAGLWFVYTTVGLSKTQFFRLEFILLPGALYMIYRAFVKD